MIQTVDVPTIRQGLAYLLRLVLLVRPYWSYLGQGMALGIVLGLVGMITPYLSKLLIDQVYPTSDTRLMHVIVGGILAIGIASTVMGAVRSYHAQVITTRLSSAIALMLFNHIQHLPSRFFDGRRVGEIMSRFQDARSSLGAVSQLLEILLVRSVYVVLVPPVLFVLSWKLAVVALISVPLTTLISAFSSRLLRRHWKRSAEAYADLNAQQIEVLSNVRMLKTFAIEGDLYRRTMTQMEHAVRCQLTATGVGGLVGAGNGTLRVLGNGVTTWLAWTLIIRQELTLGDYIAFTAYIGYLSGPITQIASLFSSFQQTAVSLARMFEYLDETPEQDATQAYEANAGIRTTLRGAIQLRDVSFAYSSGGGAVENLTFDVQQGDVIGIVGPSGAGKSTLLRLLCRSYETGAGDILFDGRSARELLLGDLRRQITMVGQDNALIQGTVWDNLVLGSSAPRRTVVEDAVRICCLDQLIQELPDGFATPVAEWGASLSAGQRQRVAIARALVRRTPIVLLDEATSNLDPEMELQILSGLFRSLAGRTVIFATHRIRNANFADRIAVLVEGRLVGFGAHGELTRSCQIYRRMYGIATGGERGATDTNLFRLAGGTRGGIGHPDRDDNGAKVRT